MDGPELIARDLALLATTNPEAFWSALHELHDALAKGAHPDAGLLALGAELHALCEAVHAGPADAALDEADDRRRADRHPGAVHRGRAGRQAAPGLAVVGRRLRREPARAERRQRRPDPALVAADRRGRGPRPAGCGRGPVSPRDRRH